MFGIFIHSYKSHTLHVWNICRPIDPLANHPNVGIYGIHGASGYLWTCRVDRVACHMPLAASKATKLGMKWMDRNMVEGNMIHSSQLRSSSCSPPPAPPCFHLCHAGNGADPRHRYPHRPPCRRPYLGHVTRALMPTWRPGCFPCPGHQDPKPARSPVTWVVYSLQSHKTWSQGAGRDPFSYFFQVPWCVRHCDARSVPGASGPGGYRTWEECTWNILDLYRAGSTMVNTMNPQQ